MALRVSELRELVLEIKCQPLAFSLPLQPNPNNKALADSVWRKKIRQKQVLKKEKLVTISQIFSEENLINEVL